MQSVLGVMSAVVWGVWCPAACAAEEGEIPPAAEREVAFLEDVEPILHQRCASCHAGENRKGGFSINTRKSLLEGGETGPAVAVGKSGESLLIELVSGVDPFRVMPAEGERLTKTEIGLLRAWIDQGLPWKDGFRFGGGAASKMRLLPRRPEVPAAKPEQGPRNPIDRLLQPYFAEQGIEPGEVVSDRVFARRVHLDLTGLLPSPEDVAAFEADDDPEKRRKLVRRLLEDRQAYATHWLSFWNDALRNAYRGTGFIDGGREQITEWLYASLYHNKPYDQFVRELIDPVEGSEGFLKGIKWRGVVNASQRREMQAAQNVSQVLLGTNLKCASCHDSFVNAWKLDDAYALANVFAEEPLEVHRCDKPTGRFVEAGFVFPQLGTIDAEAPREKRLEQLAELITDPKNGRLTLTVVNRLWARFFGRGIVEPVNNIDDPAWNHDLLDWLAVDLKEHGYDLKHTMERICTSRAYQLASVSRGESGTGEEFVFRGPLVRRMTAEQFVDGVSTLTGVWQEVSSGMLEKDGRGQGGQLAAVKRVVGGIDEERVRASLADLNPLQAALGRPPRDYAVMHRDSEATMLQALEMTNGETLTRMLQEGAAQWVERMEGDRERLIREVYLRALQREPTEEESAIARELVGSPMDEAGVVDLLWSVVMLPEFQLVY